MAKHLQEREGGDVNGFGVVNKIRIILECAHISFTVLQKLRTK
jgi:hypothetical protein